MRNKVVISVQKIVLYMCLLNVVMILPVLGNSGAIQGSRLKENIKPSSQFNSLFGVPDLLKYNGQVIHSIKQGETLSQISRDYFVPLSAVISLNRIPQPDQIKLNQKIRIPPVDYANALNGHRITRYLVQSGDTIDALCQTFGLALWQIYRLNPEIENQNPDPGRGLFVPAKSALFVNKPAPKSKPASLIGLIRPVRGLISSRFGPRWGRIHYGIDLAAPTGQPVLAVSDGRVSYAGWRGTYGQLIKVNHGTYTTYYGHLSKIIVKSGEYVTQGQTIGLVGATGRAYGSHLHFEIERSGVKLNPLLYIKTK